MRVLLALLGKQFTHIPKDIIAHFNEIAAIRIGDIYTFVMRSRTGIG